MNSPVDGTRVFAELWISFVSLVRSYTAAHDLGRKNSHTEVQSSSEQLTIRTSGSLLTVFMDPGTGEGRWALSPGERAGTFRILEDSMVEFSDRRERLDLEVAAEAFTAKILDEDRAA